MAQIGISIKKRVAFRDSVQHFSNTYHYASVDNEPNEAGARGLVDELVAFEKSCHSTAVTFVEARVWSSGGTIEQNRMIGTFALSGQGSASTSASMDRERAFLVSWPAGRNSRGKPVFLRKWFHACGFFAAVSLTSSVMDNTTGFSAADRAAIAAKADEITRIGNVEAWGLVAESGRERDGGPPIAHRYLEHHQLGDEWRG